MPARRSGDRGVIQGGMRCKNEVQPFSGVAWNKG